MIANTHQKSRRLKDPHRSVFARIFGDKEFVTTFWKLIMPSILWGGITSIVPLFFNLFSQIFFVSSNGGHSNLYIAVNYTYDTISTVNYLVVTLLFAVFPAIGNFIGYGQYRNYRETVRFAFYVGLICCFILMLFEQIFARDFALNLVYLGTASEPQIQMCTNLIRPMSFISFVFLWMWLYIPSLSSIKNTTVVFYSSIISLVFFFIADPIYLYCLTKGVAEPYNDLSLQYKAAYGIGGIYLVYFTIQPIVVYIYCKFINQFKYSHYLIKYALINIFKKKQDKIWDYEYYSKEEIKLIKYSHYLESELLFFDDFKVSATLVKQVCKLSWGNIIDQALLNSFCIVHLIFVTNFGGSLPTGDGFVLNDPSQANHAGNAFYKAIYNIPSMLITFFYGIFNAFTVAPQYFVSRELGAGNVNNAKRNAYICINWSYFMGLLFMVIIIIFAFFINKVTMPSSDPNALYVLVKNHQNGNVVAAVSYKILWEYSQNMMIIFSVILFTSTFSNMTLYVVLQGASKFIVLSDTLGKIIFTVIAIALHYSHFNNLYGYYVIPHLDRFFQWIIYMIILLSGQCFNSIHSVNKKPIMEDSKHPYEKPVVSLEKISKKDVIKK